MNKINKADYCRDDFEVATADKEEFEELVNDFSRERHWVTCDAAFHEANPNAPLTTMENINFFGLHDEPLLAPAIIKDKLKKINLMQHLHIAIEYVFHKSVTVDALIDAMSEDRKGKTRTVAGLHGTSLMASVGADGVMPVGWSAIQGFSSAFGLTPRGELNLQLFNPDYLAAVFNLLAAAAGESGVTMMYAFGKWRACNGPRYAITDDKDVWNLCNEMLNKYPQATFAKGYFNHTHTRWVIDLAAYTQDLFGQYTALIGNNYTPVLMVENSNTRESAVNLVPGLQVGGAFIPLSQCVSRPHVCDGGFEERKKKMYDSVKQAFDEVMPRFTEAAKDAEALKQIPIQYGYGTLLRAMDVVKMPRKEADEQAEIFRTIYGTELGNGTVAYPNVTAFELFAAVCDAYAEVYANPNISMQKKIDTCDGMQRAVRLDWKSLDTTDIYTRPQKS